jgi:hypothetical protein
LSLTVLEVAVVTETEQFLNEVLPQQRAAEQAIHNGHVEPRLALWSRNDPVTLYGAKLSGSGWAELEPAFREVASWFSDAVVYGSGDLALLDAAARDAEPRANLSDLQPAQRIHVVSVDSSRGKLTFRARGQRHPRA